MANEFGIGFVSAGFITHEAHVPSLEYLPTSPSQASKTAPTGLPLKYR